MTQRVIKSYINQSPKKVSEVELRAALRKVNHKNREIRESYRFDSELMSFKCI